MEGNPLILATTQITKVSIIIPVYNEEKSINGILSQLIKLYPDFEIIVIDDGSRDDTYKLIQNFNVKNIRHSFNKGYGASIKTGIRAARGSFICTLDGDGQHDPEDIRKFLEEMNNYDMVVGERECRFKESALYSFGKKIINSTANYLSRTRIPDLNSGFRLIKKDIVMKYMHLLPNGFSLSTTLTIALLRDGYNIKYVPISASKRFGKSKVTLFDGMQAFLLVIRLMTIFSPLKLFLPAAFLTFLGGAFLLVYDIIHSNIQDITLLIIFSGILIFFLGLIVDQMAHIRRELKQ
ncbi:MAG: glycosyltransferase family 2 protein [Candidatus Omnitrophica bacterium]|nr:glycosyltransferase family 2 protein [Candidatus Omnitrophota bacterium]